MFAPGLSMLWEDTDPEAALPARFGLRDLPDATRWLAATLTATWELRVESCERLLISDTNALAWVGTARGRFVAKVASHEPAFTRLAAIADLLGRLEEAGLPVAAPVPSETGARRVVAASDRPLSVAVLPLVEGLHLDVADLDAVRATGELVGGLHLALADIDPEPFGAGRLDWGHDVRGHLRAGLRREAAEAVPMARTRLAELLETLPDLAPRRQLVHGDVRGANVLVRDHRVTALLDFDELGLGHPVLELAAGAVMLATEFRRWPPAPIPAQEAFIEGYERVRALTDVERGWCAAARVAIALSQVHAVGPEGWAEVAAAIR